MNDILQAKSFDDFQTWRYDVPHTRNLLGRYERDQIVDVFGFLDYCITKSEKGNVPFNFYVDTEWRVIEETLGNLDLLEFFEESDYTYPNFLDYPAEFLLYDIAECFKFLPRLLYSWVKQLEIDTVKPIASFQKLFDAENDMFFTFNYTRTLEEVYGARQVLHVHGEIGRGILLGHTPNIDVDSFCQRNSIPSCCYHAAKVLLEITEKDTIQNSKNLDAYYLFMDREITDIYSYGFSFGEVDWPYIKDICKTLDTSKIVWHLSDYSDISERNRYQEIIRDCGFKGEFTTFNIPDETQRKDDYQSPYGNYLAKQKEYLGTLHYEMNQFILDFYTYGYNRPAEYQPKGKNKNMLYRLIKLLLLVLLERVKRAFRALFHKN